MTPKQSIKHGRQFPFDATDSWWNGIGTRRRRPPEGDKATQTARGIVANLRDRRGIRNSFEGLDEAVRKEIVKSIATIIREGMK